MVPRTIVPGETDRDRDAKDERLAYEKGMSDARTAAQFEADKRRLDAINGSIERMVEELRKLQERVAAIERSEVRRDTITETTQELVKAQSTEAITKRTFVFGVLGTITAMGGLFIAANPPT